MSITRIPYAHPPQWLVDVLKPHEDAFKTALAAGIAAAGEAALLHDFDPGMAKRAASFLFAIGAGIQVPAEIVADGGDMLVDVNLGVRDLSEAISFNYRMILEAAIRSQG